MTRPRAVAPLPWSSAAAPLELTRARGVHVAACPRESALKRRPSHPGIRPSSVARGRPEDHDGRRRQRSPRPICRRLGDVAQLAAGPARGERRRYHVVGRGRRGAVRDTADRLRGRLSVPVPREEASATEPRFDAGGCALDVQDVARRVIRGGTGKSTRSIASRPPHAAPKPRSSARSFGPREAVLAASGDPRGRGDTQPEGRVLGPCRRDGKRPS